MMARPGRDSTGRGHQKMMTRQNAPSWEEVWARLLAFRQHLPDRYEIEESLVRQYHGMVKEFESLSPQGVGLNNFRVPPEDVRPRVVSVSRPTRTRPGHKNYSHDNYCPRSALLMKLDALVQFLGPRAPSPSVGSDQTVPLLPSDRLSIAVNRYAESAGIGQWRATNLGELANAVGAHGAVLVDRLKHLREQGYLDLRKWSLEAARFVPYVAGGGSDEAFFYRYDFQIKVEPRGRPYFELLEIREQLEKAASAQQRAPTRVASESSAQLRAFLCHSSVDKTAARSLFSRLKADGFAPWLDEENILPGQDWDSEIRRAVRASHVVVACLSTSSTTKEGYVQKEIKLTLDVADEKPPGTIYLIPVRLEPCQVPDRLSGWHWVDLFDPRGYERLVAALRARDAQLRGRPDAMAPSPIEAKPPINAPQASDPTLQKRLSAAETLWSAVLDLRERFSSAVGFYTILLPSEYDSVFDEGSKARILVAPITDEFVADAVRRADLVENDRPYLGEDLWSKFFVYRAFLGRLAVLIVMGKRRHHIGDWRDDRGVREILGSVLEEQEIEGLLGSKADPHALNRAVSRLQSVILSEIRRVSSGE